MIDTIQVRHKNGPLTDMFKVDLRDESQVTLFEQVGLVCYNGVLLMNTDIWNSTTGINGDWAFFDGIHLHFAKNVDEYFEAPLARYNADNQTIEELWRTYEQP